jgi:hypothetical protein
MPDAGQRAITAIPTLYVYKKKKTTVSFVRLLLVSQRLTYDTKVEKHFNMRRLCFVCHIMSLL